MDKLLEELKKIDKPSIIGISGFGGSGKSTTAKKIGQELNIPVIGVDSFQKGGVFDTEFKLWEIMDFKRLEDQVLIPFLNNQKLIKYGHHNAPTRSIDEMFEITNNGVIIVEGVGLFRPEMSKYFSYKIWVDLPIEEAIKRGKFRDRYEHGTPTDELWDTIWKDNDLECFELFKPKENVDFIVDNS
jgi:uridine kinase